MRAEVVAPNKALDGFDAFVERVMTGMKVPGADRRQVRRGIGDGLNARFPIRRNRYYPRHNATAIFVL